MSRRAFLSLGAIGAYALLDTVYGGPLSSLVGELYARAADRERIRQAISKGLPLGVYSDRGTWSESVQACQKMLEWMGHSVSLIDAYDTRNGGLQNLGMIVFPGGNMYQYAEDISSTGRASIKRFVRNGAGYIGICGGAYLASEKVMWQGRKLPMEPLGIFPGTAQGPIDEIVPYPEYGMCKVKIVEATHPITRSELDHSWMLYYWGPALFPNAGANVTILGMYDKVDWPMMLAFHYGVGRVFLIGAHPEIEEDSDRDGNLFAEEFDDQGSDWELMRRAVAWCLKK